MLRKAQSVEAPAADQSTDCNFAAVSGLYVNNPSGLSAVVQVGAAFAAVALVFGAGDASARGAGDGVETSVAATATGTGLGLAATSVVPPTASDGGDGTSAARVAVVG